MVIGQPAPFVRTFVAAVDDAIRESHPSHTMSATQRAWLAFCVTAVLVTNSICWARFERASLGTYSLAAMSWMFRHSKMPWDKLLVASVRVILRHHGITSGNLVIDDTDNPRSKSAKALAYLYKLRDKDSGGYLWGQSLVFLLLLDSCDLAQPHRVIRGPYPAVWRISAQRAGQSWRRGTTGHAQRPTVSAATHAPVADRRPPWCG